jgi:hypothetical protein
VTGVRILGDGVAASCCVHLLRRAGQRLFLERADRPKVPAIMLGDTAQKMLSDIFERADLFEGIPRIRKRMVAWGTATEALVLPHSAVVISEETLLNRIHPRVEVGPDTIAPEPEWTIFASRPLPPGSTIHHFGSRMAAASGVKLKVECDAEACWVESLPAGWLFLLPMGELRGWLLSVGGEVPSLLEQSRLIARQIDGIEPPGKEFPCYPRIAEPLCEPARSSSGSGRSSSESGRPSCESGWLSCGTAALGFDPLCGDGAGNAAREAILGSAVICAVAGGADEKAVLAHYRGRLLAGFRRHLGACLEFYESGGRGPWWDQQVAEIHRGLEWSLRRFERGAGVQYRLKGFSLEAV